MASNFIQILSTIGFGVVVGLVGFDVVLSVGFVGIVLPVVFGVVVVLPVDDFKVLVLNEVDVVRPQLQAVVGFTVACTAGVG